MEADDLALIEKLAPQHPELRHLYSQHLSLNEQVATLEAVRNPTDAERREMSELKYKKLHGKNRIQQILTAVRAAGDATER